MINEMLPLMGGCVGCHSSSNEQGDYLVDTSDAATSYAEVTATGPAGVARVVPSDSGASLMVILTDGDATNNPNSIIEMPGMDAAQIQTMIDWIDQGAAQ